MADRNDNPETQDTEQTTTPQAGDLGQQLKRCREKAGLDIEQAASEMRLSPHLVRSLEEEDFQTLPEPPYVRGYLRSYAKLSDSDPNRLISLYEALRGGDSDFSKQFTPLTSIDRVAKPGISSFTAKLLGLLLLLAILGGLSMMPDVRNWMSNVWSSFSEKVEGSADSTQNDAATDDDTANDSKTDDTGSDKTQTDSAPVQTSSASSAINIPKLKTEEASAQTDAAGEAKTKASESDTATTESLALSGDIQRDDSTGTPGDDDATADADSTDAATATGATTDEPAENTTENTADNTTDAQPTDTDTATTDSTASDADNNTTDTAPADNEDTSDTTTTAATEAADDTDNTAASAEEQSEATTEATENGVDTTKQPIDGDVSIRLEFEQEVWLQIRNTDGKPIFETLKSAGHKQELKAHTPLKFKVGNAPGVKIYLNGVLFDQKPHTRGNVANFEVK